MLAEDYLSERLLAKFGSGRYAPYLFAGRSVMA